MNDILKLRVEWGTDVPEDIEDPDEGVLFDTGDESFVNVLHNPVEELGIDMFGKGVTGVGGLNTGEGLYVRLCGCFQLPMAQPLRHILVGHTNQFAECHQVAIVGLQEEERILIMSTRHLNKMTAESPHEQVCSYTKFLKWQSSAHNMEIDAFK